MYIKSLVLDGFKSYGTRTEIAGFDQRFNAITGLNGSGKSNILDAICFVLGLSNMSLARCTTLRELIYKNGQAGVTKAVVTMTLDNSDTDHSPLGYEHHKEIVIRREVHLNSRTKYYVCGQSSSNNQVSDLFHSVHLNISNPHFLIMQGRITKVLNMKAHEILSMLEEATGVSMYEIKKKLTQNTIEKKDSSLKFIDTLIEETILPKLDELRKDQANLLDFQNLQSELEKLSKLEIAWHFEVNQRKATKVLQKLENCQQLLSSHVKEMEDKKKLKEDLNQQIEEGIRNSDELSGGQITEIERKLKEEDKVEIRELGILEKETDSCEEVKKEKSDIERQLAKDEQLETKNSEKLTKIKEETFEQDDKEAEAEFEKAQRNYDAIASGKAMNDEGEAAQSLADQLIRYENDYNQSNTDTKITTAQLSNREKQLKEKKAEAQKYKGEFERDNKQINELQNEVNSVEAQIKKISFNPETYDKLQEEKTCLISDLNNLKNQIRIEESDHSGLLNFEYTNPSPDFKRSSIKGLVCKLFTVKDPKYARAVEAAAGGRLFNVIAENEQACRQILDRGNLRRRFDFLALNKIQGRTIDRQSVELARKLANDSDVHPAIDIIEFDEYLRPAMEYIFGDTFIAPSVDKAMKITYSQLKRRAVTFDGDKIMLGGDMSGGAAPKQDSILVKLVSLKEKYETVNRIEDRLAQIQKEIALLDGPRRALLSLQDEIKARTTRLETVRDRLKKTNTHHRLFDEVSSLESEISELRNKLTSLREVVEKSSTKMQELKQRLANQEQSRKEELANAEKALSKAKSRANATKKVRLERNKLLESLVLENEMLQKNRKQYLQKIEKFDNILEEKLSKLEIQKKLVDECKQRVQELRNSLKERKAKLRQQNDEVNKLVKKRDKMDGEINLVELEIKKIKHEMTQIDTEGKTAASTVKSMLNKYDWINEEKHLFGKDNSDYPFYRKDFNINEIANRNQKLKSTVNSMAKTVNPRASMLLSDKEREFDELKRKRAIIEEDRDKLIKYMDEVDRKKRDALHEAWTKVNVDFDSIFSTFLPTTHAKLDLVPGKDLLDGLEVRVAFGGVWKESLTELSGGQRSLVALSLILALLKYNPAPLYILDEVDAALDQNHTQNTGTMIKKHFSNSQFVIVSLKDDMFRNANVLFKTKFVNGKSAVTRYTHGGLK